MFSAEVPVFPALHLAAWKGELAVAKFLLDNGAMPHLELAAVVDRASCPFLQGQGLVRNWTDLIAPFQPTPPPAPDGPKTSCGLPEILQKPVTRT